MHLQDLQRKNTASPEREGELKAESSVCVSLHFQASSWQPAALGTHTDRWRSSGAVSRAFRLCRERPRQMVSTFSLYFHLLSMASVTLHHPFSQRATKALAGNQGSAAKPKKLTRHMGRLTLSCGGPEGAGPDFRKSEQRTASGPGQVGRGGISLACMTYGPNSGPLRPGRRVVAETSTGDSSDHAHLGQGGQRKLGQTWQTAGRPREAPYTIEAIQCSPAPENLSPTM